MSAISARAMNFRSRSIPTGSAAGRSPSLPRAFGLAHERIYGFKLDQPVELVNLRAVGVGAVQKISLPKFDKEGPDAAARGRRAASRLFRRQLLLRLMFMIVPSCGPATGSAARRSSSRWMQRPSSIPTTLARSTSI